MSVSTARLPAAQRRLALIEAALHVFSQGSYSRATTAEIARAAGVSEPILYRHFPSKRALYLACLDETWIRLRLVFAERLAELGDAEGPVALRSTVKSLRAHGVLPPNLWVQALTEAGHDAVIRRHLRAHMTEVHSFVADVVRRAQAAGGVPADRDPEAEAWIFIGVGLLASVADRLGGLVDADCFAAIGASRMRWLMNRPPEPSA